MNDFQELKCDDNRRTGNGSNIETGKCLAAHDSEWPIRSKIPSHNSSDLANASKKKIACSVAANDERPNAQRLHGHLHASEHSMINVAAKERTDWWRSWLARPNPSDDDPPIVWSIVWWSPLFEVDWSHWSVSRLLCLRTWLKFNGIFRHWSPWWFFSD